MGFGLYASVLLALSSIEGRFGARPTSFYFDVARSAAQFCAIFIWYIYLLRPVRHKTIEVLPKAHLEQWNQALLEVLHRRSI